MTPSSGSTATRTTGLSDKEFARFGEFIYQQVGIKLPPIKKTMVEARLQKRIRLLGMSDHKQYLEFLFSQEGLTKELTNLIDAVTTNTTDFFREPQHFAFLVQQLLPAWFANQGRSRILRLWSAGCSTGMEPYTLAMVMSEYAEQNQGFHFNILATDISTQALQTAIMGIYDLDRVQPVPELMKRKYLLRSKERSRRQVRIVPELRRRVDFGRLNFMEDFTFENPMDIIFCRNVVIYFDRPTQLQLFNKFCQVLDKGGHLFIGHSESIAGMDLPLRQVIPTVYQRV